MDNSKQHPDAEQPTIPHQESPYAPPRYDYNHLRESKEGNHWYASPPNAEVAAAASAVTQPSAAAYHNAPPSPAPAVPPVMPPPPPPPNYNTYGTMPPPASPVRQRIQTRRQRRAKGMPSNWAWVVIALALLGSTLICSLLLLVGIQAINGDNSDEVALSNVPLIEPTSIIYQDGGALAGNSLEIQSRKWDGQERFTMLLMGLDKRPDESGTAFRSDTMILISLDPKTNTIGILSIPRDLYVEVPYYGLHRINAAYVLGELEQPGNGPTLAKQTVQYNFGIPVNEYVTVDFQTVISIVDAVGGVEIEVPNAITDYEYPTMDYGTEVFHVDAGWQTMDGTTALKYARTRHASDDIDRARRQQQVMYAIRDKVTSLDMVDDLVVQAPFLYAEFKDGVHTGLSFEQMIQLAIWAADVPRENIKNGVVSWEYLIGYQTPSGGSVLVPDRASIGSLMVEVFGENYDQP